MGGVNVKITMIERVLQNVAPHPCYSCGKVGSNLCPYCKYDIVSEPFMGCILCAAPNARGICAEHVSPLLGAFVVSQRTGALEAAINGLKFSRNKSCARTLAELLHDSLPLLPNTTIVTPIPTIATHIRQRGYDQVDLIARHFAKLRNLAYAPLLMRRTKAVQHTSNKSERAQQSAVAFGLKPSVNTYIQAHQRTVLLIDDIITTGSTVVAAGELLNKSGFSVYVAALAYQPLD